jgi:cytochrome c biogenesis protein CcmG/thiol:disulfide interchange protein DsbE
MPARVRETVARIYRAALAHKVTAAVFGASLAAIVALGAVAATSGTATSGTGTSGTGTPGTGAPGASSPSHPATNQQAPDFSLAALGGAAGKVSLAAYAGRPVIVNFFASWCVPCRKETPLLAHYYRATHGSVAVVGIDSNDSQAAAVTFTRTEGVSYPLAYDPVASTAGAFGVAEIPQTFFLNARHRIVDRVFGAVTAADLAKGVALMGQPARPS